MRCETARMLSRRMPRLGAWLIRRHLLRCRDCRKPGDLEIRPEAFFQVAEFKNEDLWPEVIEKIAPDRVAFPGNAEKSEALRIRLRHREAPRLRPAHAGAAILFFAAVAGVIYFGIPALRDTSGQVPYAALSSADHPVSSETTGHQASIDAAFVQGRSAKVFIYVRPKNTTMSFFWIEPQKDPDTDKRSKGENT